MFRKFAIGITVALAMSGSALAQDFSMPMNNPVLDNVEFGRQIKSIVDQGQGQQQSQQQYSPQSQSVSPANLTYKISMQRRQANYDSFVKKSMAANRVAGEEMRGMFAKGDPIQMVGGTLQSKFGMRVDNVSDTYAMWMIAAWWVANNQDGELNRSTFTAVKAQVANGMLSTSGMATATDEVKQNMAESLLIFAIMLDSTAEAITNDPAKRKQLAASVMAKTKQEMGIDLSTITLTDQGFVPRRGGKRGDAGEAIDAADPVAQAGQLASANDASGGIGGFGAGDAALLIAAVSAGAGGLFMIGKGLRQRQG